MNSYNKILQQNGITSDELIKLLELREKGEVDFLLVDVREEFEYNSAHIDGVDILAPTSSFRSWIGEFIQKYKNKSIIFTCRTDNRSGQVCNILRKYGINAINHLGGIVSYRGKIIK
jgi:rhodanese-related sulfurtransferase